MRYPHDPADAERHECDIDDSCVCLGFGDAPACPGCGRLDQFKADGLAIMASLARQNDRYRKATDR